MTAFLALANPGLKPLWVAGGDGELKLASTPRFAGWEWDVKLVSLFVALMLDEIHEPACGDDSADEKGEAEDAEADHHAGLGALGDAEDDRR